MDIMDNYLTFNAARGKKQDIYGDINISPCNRGIPEGPVLII